VERRDSRLDGSVYEALGAVLSQCASRKKALEGSLSEPLEVLLLSMFELGTDVGAVNCQDLVWEGVERIRAGTDGGNKGRSTKKERREAREQAYKVALAEAEANGFKPTYGGLLNLLRSSDGQQLRTGVPGCELIWFAASKTKKSDIYDSINAPEGPKSERGEPTSSRTINRIRERIRKGEI